MGVTLYLSEQTHKRLVSVRDDLLTEKRRDLDYDDVINLLIDVYADSKAFSGENAGG